MIGSKKGARKMTQNSKFAEMRENPKEYRKVFDTIPEQFDKFRPRYSADLFEYFIKEAGIGPETKVLEIGPGTGQATDPILDTGCDYNAIELGEHLYAKMKEKYGSRPNFHIVNDDFITHDFGEQKFDVIYSAATIQWIPERVAFPKTLELLKPGGTLAMMFLIGDYKTPNEELFNNIQKVYNEYYKPVTEYKNMKEPFDYLHATDYGYVDLTRHDFYGKRTFTADEYVQYCGTHSDHILIPEPYRTPFFEGLRSTVLAAGNKVEFYDTYVLYLTKKPTE
jgi:trans-aconitate methyltransferase